MAKWAVLIISLSIAAISCSSGVKEGSEKRITAGEKEKDVKDYMVKILPESPTVADSIVAEVKIGEKGKLSSKLGFIWEKNGQEIKGLNFSRIDGSSLKRGDVIRVKIIPEGGEAKGEVFYAEPVVIQNALPIVTGIKIKPDKNISKKEPIIATVEGKDADGDTISYKYQWIKNGAEEIEGANSNRLSLANYKRGDFVNVRVTANDGFTDSAPATSGPVAIVNTPPEILSQPPADIRAYEYRYKVSASDADGDALKYSLTTTPSGMAIDSATGEIKWKITEKDEGSHKIEVVVEDGNGGRAIQSYSLTINLPR